MKAAPLLAIASLLCLAAGVQAETCIPNDDRGRGPYAFFLESSTISYPIEKKTLHAPGYYGEWGGNDFDNQAFEAYVGVSIPIHNGLSRQDLQKGSCGWSKVWTFAPMFRLRQLSGFSSPLRSPSFTPRFLSMQLLKVARSDTLNNWGSRSTTLGSWAGNIHLWNLQFILQHHSNGGPGCLYLEDSQSGQDCDSDIPAYKRTVDTAGSFSTDYLEVRGAMLRGKIGGNGLLLHSWSLSAGAELHSRWLVLLPGYIGREQQSIYGPYRAKLGGEYQSVALKHFKWVNDATLQYIFYEHRPSTQASPVAIDASTSLVLDTESGFYRGWGLTARYYQGQDYYNLFFFRDIRRVFLGIVIDPNSMHLNR